MILVCFCILKWKLKYLLELNNLNLALLANKSTYLKCIISTSFFISFIYILNESKCVNKR